MFSLSSYFHVRIDQSWSIVWGWRDILYNHIAQGKLAVWSAIEERVFRVELHLGMKGYCWRESQAKIVAIVKIKIQLVLGKKHLGSEQIYRKWMSAKFWTNLSFCKIRGNQSHWKVRENVLTLTLKGFLLFAHWRGSQKYKTFSFARVASAMWFNNNSLSDEKILR